MLNQTHAKPIHYRADIDGLRAIAVLSVITFHAFPALLRGGFVGVDIFFFISGFLISSIIFNALEQNKFGFIHFYFSRIKRIFPALILVLSTCSLFAWLSLFPAEFKQLGKHITGGVCFIDNFLLCRESGYFDTRTELKPLLHLWSLSIEEQFYLFFPLFIWMCWRFFSKERCFLVLFLIAAVSFLVNLKTLSTNASGAFFFPQARIWELLFGCMFAYITLFLREKIILSVKQNLLYQRLSRSNHHVVQNVCSMVGFTLLLVSVLFIHQEYFFPGFWPFLPLFGTALMVVAGPKAWCNRKILAHPIMVWVGLISYPLYLWHWPILSFIRITSASAPSVSYLVFALIASILLAWLTYRLLERPIRFGPHSTLKVVLLCAGAGILAVGGYTMFYEKTHPRSASVQPLGNNIISAINEWEYPQGLKSFSAGYGKTAYRIGGTDKITLFFGDSNIEQYSPRVVELFKTKHLNDRGAVFLTGGGCPPFEWKTRRDHPYCEQLVDAFLQLAADEHIDTVVVGAAWFGYFEPNLFKAADEKGGQNAELIAMQASLDHVFKAIARPNRKVYLVLSIPSGAQVDPRSYIERDFFHIRQANNTVKPIDQKEYIAENKGAYAVLARIAQDNKLTVIDPLHFLCEHNQCFALDSDGKAKYKDSGHLRPTYVRNKLFYLDKVMG